MSAAQRPIGGDAAAAASDLARKIASQAAARQAAFEAAKAKITQQHQIKLNLDDRFAVSNEAALAPSSGVGRLEGGRYGAAAGPAATSSGLAAGAGPSPTADGSQQAKKPAQRELNPDLCTPSATSSDNGRAASANPPLASSSGAPGPASSGAGAGAGLAGKKRALLSFAAGDEDEDEDDGGLSIRPKRPALGPGHGAASSNGTGTTAATAGAQADNTNSSTGASGPVPARARLGRDPTVQTAFLRDRDSEAQEAAEAARLEREWEARQDELKKQPLEVTYSYWDGTGHRRAITIQQGTTVGRFLELARQDLAGAFPELKTLSSDSLLFIKEDLILPHTTTFYTLIATKARGKSGPLFSFEVYDDVRLKADARVEKDEAHPGKIVRRAWYNANKHVFPASRWELYDPSIQRAEGYTTHGNEVR